MNDLKKRTPSPNMLYETCWLREIRIKEYEDTIARSETYGFMYAKNIIKKRWIRIEKNLQTPKIVYHYTKSLVKKRWQKAENILINNGFYACLYAKEIIKGRWPEAEKTILTNPQHSLDYALDVIGDRWQEAELIISQQPAVMALYAKKLLKNQLPEEMHNKMIWHALNKNKYAMAYFKYLKELGIKGE